MDRNGSKAPFLIQSIQYFCVFLRFVQTLSKGSKMSKTPKNAQPSRRIPIPRSFGCAGHPHNATQGHVAVDIHPWSILDEKQIHLAGHLRTTGITGIIPQAPHVAHMLWDMVAAAPFRPFHPFTHHLALSQ